MNTKTIASKYNMLSFSEVELIQKCVFQLQEEPLVINIGANVGTSTIAILEIRPKAYIFSIDVKPCPEEATNIMACNLSPK